MVFSVHVCVRVCVHGCYTVPQSREIRMELSHICPPSGFSDLSLKHLVLASIRDRILTLVSKQVWQFPYFQVLDTNRLFPSRGWLIFLANADSQMPLFSLTPNTQPQAEGQRVDPGCFHARKINLDSQKTEQSVQEVTGWSQFLFRFRNLNREEGGG